MNEARNPVKAVQTALDIVDSLQEHRRMGVTELATDLDVSKGTIHSHLSTLRQNGYVVWEDGTYRLGPQFLDMSHHVRNRFEIYDLVTDEVDTLAERSGELALFTVEEQGKGVCLYKASGDMAVQTELYVGYRNDLHHTAVGKAILAYMPRERRDELVGNLEFTKHTEHTISTREQLRAELEDVRDDGIAFNREETIAGLVGAGAPVRTRDGGVYGAVSVIGPTSRMTGDRLDEISEMIHHAVNVIEINSTSIAR